MTGSVAALGCKFADRARQGAGPVNVKEPPRKLRFRFVGPAKLCYIKGNVRAFADLF
jgi:hypothetical protein